jgi:hypothetical protein
MTRSWPNEDCSAIAHNFKNVTRFYWWESERSFPQYLFPNLEILNCDGESIMRLEENAKLTTLQLYIKEQNNASEVLDMD